jgi:hypothetical protein
LRRPAFAARTLLGTGAIMAGWILVQVIDRPAVLGFVDRSNLSMQVGAWLGLLGALLVAGAGVLATLRPNRAPGD